MPTPAPAAPGRSRKDLLLGLLLLALAGLGIFAFARRTPEPPARPSAGDRLLEGRFPFEDGVLARRVRVDAPARLEIRIEPPAGETVTASFGPPGPVEASRTDGPDPARAARWTVKAGDAPRVETVLAYGLYVVRVERAPGLAAASARVTVRALPPR